MSNNEKKPSIEELQREWFEQQKKDREQKRKTTARIIGAIAIIAVIAFGCWTVIDQKNKEDQLKQDFMDSYSMIVPNQRS